MAQVGLKDLYLAILEEDTKEALSYELPELVTGAINATINPEVNTQELYADDQLWESVSALGKINVEVETVDLPLPIRSKILGSKMENGVLIENKEDVQPYLALGFKSLKSNGKYRYLWLMKGKAQPLAEDYASKKDNVDHKTPVVKITFIPRRHDGEWKRTADEDSEEFVGAETWFAKVPGDPKGVIVIKTQPVSVTVTEGTITGDLSVAALAVGTTGLTYQWYSNDEDSNTDGTLIAGETGTKFDIPDDLDEGEYYYYCEITADGADKVVSDVATVTVEGGA